MAVSLIIPAGGSGSRLGRPEPKALVELGGRPLICRTLEELCGIVFHQTVVAAPRGHVAAFENLLEDRAVVVPGGDTRSSSVRNAFLALRWFPQDTVVIHDAARPFVSASETQRVIRAAEESGAAIAAIPIVDTVKRVEQGRVVATLDREGLCGAATPQAFRAELLARLLSEGQDSTDEAALFEEAGLPVSVVFVSRLGFKITKPEDLALAEAILAGRAG